MRRPLGVVVVALAVAACGGPEDCTVSAASCGNAPPVITLTPLGLARGLGDTASIAVAVKVNGSAVTPAARWTVAAPPVVTLDSQTVAQPRVRLRATAVGSSVVNVSITVSGQTYFTAVPVTVAAR